MGSVCLGERESMGSVWLCGGEESMESVWRRGEYGVCVSGGEGEYGVCGEERRVWGLCGCVCRERERGEYGVCGAVGEKGRVWGLCVCVSVGRGGEAPVLNLFNKQTCSNHWLCPGFPQPVSL